VPQLLIRNANLVDGSGAAARAADIVVSGGKIERVAAAGSVDPAGVGEVIDAEGKLVTPGFVDVHTHYDGQATWDDLLAPSSWHGVTSVVMGNCGVGFAPVRPNAHQELIELMEGVEDIPGSALSEGIRWNWESFPEYLDALERMPRSIEIAAQVPHGAVRAYVIPELAAQNGPANANQIAAMADIVREAVAAGAVAFSTNRLPLHTSIHGEPVPGTYAQESELSALLQAVREGGGSIVETVPAGAMGENPAAPLAEVELYRKLSIEHGIAITFSLARRPARAAGLGAPGRPLAQLGYLQSVCGSSQFPGARRAALARTPGEAARTRDPCRDPGRSRARRGQHEDDDEQSRRHLYARERARLRARSRRLDRGALCAQRCRSA
jgi:N-acyl-D-aspartate/D-glutamate deacylase